jgi:hypothetical protein
LLLEDTQHAATSGRVTPSTWFQPSFIFQHLTKHTRDSRALITTLEVHRQVPAHPLDADGRYFLSLEVPSAREVRDTRHAASFNLLLHVGRCLYRLLVDFIWSSRGLKNVKYANDEVFEGRIGVYLGQDELG